MSDQEVLEMFTPLVDFIAEICGEDSEVILHDVSSPEQSAIAIRNGQHSGRTVGSPLTDLAMQICTDKQYEGQHFLSNYRGHAKGKDFISSTFFIRNGERLIGLLCVNTDTAPARELKFLFNQFINRFDTASFPVRADVEENLNNSIPSVVQSRITNAIRETGVTPERMKMAEKIALVQSLNAQGVLLMKGAVSEIAACLNISEPTIYRYLNHKPRPGNGGETHQD